MGIKMEKIAADQHSGASPGGPERPDRPTLGEKSHFLEHAGIREKNLPVDVKNRSLAEEGGGIVKQAFFPGRFLDESHNQGQSSARFPKGRKRPGGPGILGRFGDKVAQFIAGQAQFRKHEKIGLGPPGFFDVFEMEVEISSDVAQDGRKLGQGDFHALKVAQISGRAKFDIFIFFVRIEQVNHIALYLKDIYFGKKTGNLTFSRTGIEKSFFFQDGGLLFAKTNVSEERLGEILLRTGKITPEVFAGIAKYVRPDMLLGEALVQNRVLSQRGLYDGVLAQMYAVILGCFVFFDGKFSFDFQERCLDAEFQLRVSLPLLIEKGVRSMSFHPAIHSFFSGKTLIAKEGELLSSTDEKERALWQRLDGSSNIEYIMTWDASDPNWFWKSMFLLYTLGLAEFKGSPATVAIPEPEPLSPSPFMTNADAAASAEPAAPPETTVFQAPTAESRPGEREADESSKDINEAIYEAVELRKRMGNLDHHQLFGLSPSASETEIKKAYFAMARKFHPDRFGRDLAPDLKKQIDNLFDRITKSYKALMTPGGAAVPPEPDSSAEDADKDPGKNADTRFRQGKTLYNQARYEEAVQYLEEAVRMNDNKGDYFLLLALAQSKVGEFSKKAEKNFLRAIELEPWNPEGIVGLGILYKKEGLANRAKKQFERALQIEPGHQAARQELDTMGGGAEDKKGKSIFSSDIFGSKKKK